MPLTCARAQHLRDTHPGWSIVQTEAGRWWAVNWATTPADRSRGAVATLDADTLDRLGELLNAQRTRRTVMAP